MHISQQKKYNTCGTS